MASVWVRNERPIMEGGEDEKGKKGEKFACIFYIASCRRILRFFLGEKQVNKACNMITVIDIGCYRNWQSQRQDYSNPSLIRDLGMCSFK